MLVELLASSSPLTI